MEPQRRRQNKNCDPCRKSKRKCCSMRGSNGEIDPTCVACKRLGHRCTYEFVESQLLSGSKRKKRKGEEHLSDEVAEIDWGALMVSPLPAASVPLGLDANAQGNSVIDHFPVDASVDGFFGFGFGDLENVANFESPFASPPLTSVLPSKDTPSRVLKPVTTPDRSPKSNPKTKGKKIFGSQINSPTHLLNASAIATIVEGRLGGIYEIIANGCASRCLDYYSNPYPGNCRYRFEDSDGCCSSEPPESDTRFNKFATFNLDQKHMTESKPTSVDPTNIASHPGIKMTLLGVVRFLDNFSDLYGNKMHPSSRIKSDVALRDVLRAFSSQWFPCSSHPETKRDPTSRPSGGDPGQTRPSSSDIFIDTWIQARSSLCEARDIRSFKLVYATLLFDGIDAPPEVSIPLRGKPDDLFGNALHHLRLLEKFVEQYCRNLGASSSYGQLMMSSLNIIRWFAYIRDTARSLISPRRCLLPDTLGLDYVLNENSLSYVSSPTSPTIEYEYHIIELNNPRTLKRALTTMILSWRHIMKLRNLIEDFSGSRISPGSELAKAIASTSRAIDFVEGSHRAFLNQSVENLQSLTKSSRTSAVFLVVFWDLGVLLFAEQLKLALLKLDHFQGLQLASKIRNYESTAASSVARMAECILSLPPDQTSEPQNCLGPEIPLTAYHMSPNLIVTALTKAIEKIIDRQFSPDLVGAANDDSSFESATPWNRYLAPLMKCLVSLDVTIAGARSVNKALPNLMRKYGDILSECWSPECEAETDELQDFLTTFTNLAPRLAFA